MAAKTKKPPRGNILGKVRNQLEIVDDLASSGTTALDTEGQHTAEAPFQIPLRGLVVGVALQSGVRNPADVLVLLEPACQSKSVAGVTFGAQAQSLQTQQELLSCEGVQSGTEIPEDLNADADGERNRSEGLPELEAMVAFRWLNELREPGCMFAPVELAAVNHHTANGRAVSTDPFCCAVDDNISTVLNRTNKETTSTEGVVNLAPNLSKSSQNNILERKSHAGRTTRGTPFS